jgi:2-polyprenyl-6-methoxyphenol hydroxylase-like FAD-dependent oxidoreductase
MPAELFGGEGIVAEIEIMRGDLTRILFEATRDDTEYIFDDRIAELSQGEEGVKVLFRSGTPRTFDLVVGADGVHSGVRDFAFGPETDYVRHLGAYTAYFTVPDPGDLDGWFLLYNAPGRRNAGIRPERGGTAKAMLSFASPPLNYDRQDVRQQQKILADAFAGVGWRVPALLDAMWDTPDFYFDTVCKVEVERWWRGRAVLLGDAGNCGSPLTGLGTSTALVGAYVLAGELAGTPDDHEAAFARYQEQMRDYVAECHKLPPGGVKGYLPQTHLAIAMRNLSMRMMTARPMRGLMAKQFQKADAITLKEYA